MCASSRLVIPTLSAATTTDGKSAPAPPRLLVAILHHIRACRALAVDKGNTWGPKDSVNRWNVQLREQPMDLNNLCLIPDRRTILDSDMPRIGCCCLPAGALSATRVEARC